MAQLPQNRKKTRRFPPPWSVEELEACFVVRDHNGQALAYVYFEEEPGRRSSAKLLNKDEHGGLRPTWRSCRTYCGRSSPASIKIEKINGGKGDDDSGETEPKHITNIVPGHALPSFYFG